MTAVLSKSDDSVLDRRIGMLLITGVLISASVIVVGGALFLTLHGHTIPDFRVFHGEPAHLRTLSGITSEALHGNSLAIIQFGLLLLIATPVARVAFSVFEFFMERDFLYVAISALVLAVLLYSLIGHGAH